MLLLATWWYLSLGLWACYSSPGVTCGCNQVLPKAAVSSCALLSLSLFFFFWAALDRHCFVRAFSSCGRLGRLSRGGWAFHCCGFSCFRAQALGVQALEEWHTGSAAAACRPLERAGLSGCSTRALEHRVSTVVACGRSFPMVCGIFPDQGSNLCPLHWQMDSYPKYHQGSTTYLFIGEESLLQRPAGQLQLSEAPVDRIINSCSCCNRG